MEVHMSVQAGAKAVDEGHRADVQRRLVHLRRTWAVAYPRARHDSRQRGLTT
jgi:hypothetical protein